MIFRAFVTTYLKSGVTENKVLTTKTTEFQYRSWNPNDAKTTGGSQDSAT